MGPSIKYVHKIFIKINISNPLIRTLTYVILRTHLIDGPYLESLCLKLPSIFNKNFGPVATSLSLSQVFHLLVLFLLSSF